MALLTEPARATPPRSSVRRGTAAARAGGLRDCLVDLRSRGSDRRSAAPAAECFGAVPRTSVMRPICPGKRRTDARVLAAPSCQPSSWRSCSRRSCRLTPAVRTLPPSPIQLFIPTQSPRAKRSSPLREGTRLTASRLRAQLSSRSASPGRSEAVARRPPGGRDRFAP
jgi:hypothetical protein